MKGQETAIAFIPNYTEQMDQAMKMGIIYTESIFHMLLVDYRSLLDEERNGRKIPLSHSEVVEHIEKIEEMLKFAEWLLYYRRYRIDIPLKQFYKGKYKSEHKLFKSLSSDDINEQIEKGKSLRIPTIMNTLGD